MRLGRRLATGTAEHPPAPRPRKAPQTGEAPAEPRRQEPVPAELGAER